MTKTLLVVPFLIGASAFACSSDTVGLGAHQVATIDVSAKAELELDQLDTASAIARNESGTPIGSASVSWGSTFPDVATVTSEGVIHPQAPGTTEIIASVDGKIGRKRIEVVPPSLVFNEVNPNGALAAGWVEIFNSTNHPIDLTHRFIASVIGPSHVEVYNFPNGAAIAPGEFVVVDEDQIPGSLNANGTLLLFSPTGVASDEFEWTANVPGTAYARCPDGDRLGSLVPTTTPTRKAPNVCGP
jgi:Lamin Tail Domain